MFLTRNFYTALRTFLFANGQSAIGSVQSSSNGMAARYVYTIGSFKDTNENIRTQVSGIYPSANADYSGYAIAPSYFNGSLGSYFAVGSGTTAPTLDDHVVESPISNVNITTTGQNSADGSYTYHVIVTATADITISEICMLKNTKTDCISGTAYTVLVGRTVLPTGQEVHLTNGQSKTFDITISLPIPA